MFMITEAGTYRRRDGKLASLRPDPSDPLGEWFRDDWNEHYVYAPGKLWGWRSHPTARPTGADILEKVEFE